jgi:SAM-dependent methyltransferase
MSASKDLQARHDEAPLPGGDAHGGTLPQVSDLLACPRCHGAVDKRPAELLCRDCGLRCPLNDNVVLTLGDAQNQYFEQHYEVMTENNQVDSVWQLFYSEQVRIVEEALRPGTVLADIGCGPKTAYRKRPGSFVIGVEPSLSSIRVNHDLDLRIHGAAAALPLASASVDLITCFYSVHHMIGATVAETRRNVTGAFAEFGRVLKPGGRLLIFEVSPWPLIGLAERLAWNGAKALLGPKIDFFFWSPQALRRLGAMTLPRARFSRRTFHTSWTATFPPAFAIQWLRVPRILYPFSVNMYSWTT